MIVLVLYAFFAGIITILSPCILPLLPIILSSSTTSSAATPKRPLGIIFGFIASFTFFTLFLSAIVQATSISPNLLRNFSIVVVFLLGLSLLSSRFQLLVEKIFSALANKLPSFDNGGNGFWSGVLVGLSLGILWTPCVGPILASVITLAITGEVTLTAFVITLAYAIGTAIPMFIILIGGRSLFTKVPWLLSNTQKIQKIFGVFTIFIALAIWQNWDRSFQVYILKTFPNYGTGLTKIEQKGDLSLLNNTSTKELPILKKAPEIIPGGEWFNSEPLKISELKGKVVLVDFWTYTCINCIRTLPYLKSWHSKYEKDGLVVMGIHSPEFEFEKDKTNVSQAIKDFQIQYPVVQDNNFATWRAYQNNYWPAKYLIDVDGNLRYTHFGEGDYAETETNIQTLLKEISTNVDGGITKITEQNNYAKTPEIYLGLGRGDYSVGTRFQKDKITSFSAVKSTGLHQVNLAGDFLVSEEFLGPQKNSSLQLRFDAKEVFLVMSATESSKVKVFVDDKLQYFGKDNINGEVVVDSNRLYHLISIPEAGKHLLRLEFDNNFVKIFAFTFG